MARYTEPTPEEEAGYQAWVASRQPHVRAIAARFEPWSLYRLKSSNHRVIVRSFGEQADGTVTLTVRVSGAFNALLFERDVFGIDPDDLEPCDLPTADEPVGSLLTPPEVEQNRDALRLLGRPDLWVRDETTGKVVRR